MFRSSAETKYHRDSIFEETYEKFYQSLCNQKESQKSPKLKIRDIRALSSTQWRLDVDPRQLLEASPQEGWGFYVPDLIRSGKVSRVELQKSYIVVRCGEAMDRLGIREIFLRPLDFLHHLRTWASEKLGPLPRLYRELPLAQAQPIQPRGASNLRDRQLEMLHYSTAGKAYLWGPPGTGKTYTVGRLAVEWVQRGYRVLLLAPTNVAVDVATLQIDQAFQSAGIRLAPGALLRAGTPQLEALESQEHLLAWQQHQKETQRELTRLKRRRGLLRSQLSAETRPSKQLGIDRDLEEINAEILEYEAQRKEYLWTLVGQAQVLCSTVHSSFQRRELCSFCETEKLAVIYDEAGMVARFALVPILALLSGEESPCGRLSSTPKTVSLVFSGDPMQLSPITQCSAQDVNAFCWQGHSLMEELPANTVMLEEQSRMDRQICQVVSSTYYAGRLRTLPDPQRLAVPLLPEWPEEGIFLVDPTRSAFTPMHDDEDPRDYLRPTAKAQKDERSIRVGARLIRWALQREGIRKVLWLSPFRAQALLIRQACDFFFTTDEEEAVVLGGTIHVSQGDEADLVVIDPVNVNNLWFTRGGKDIDRLINVALSRARTQVVVLTSRNKIRRQAAFWRPLHGAHTYVLRGNPDGLHRKSD